ncbi:MAG TPA: DJ-1/PfpI family protein [Gemmatales bacterium]|mgnify:CR=1 FL=1|nr:DJ-1/PfpI family protein [Gemmatales bacterium]
MKTRRVAIVVFDDVAVLDFAGPYEVFSVTGWQREMKPFEVFLVAEKPGPIVARNRFSINPHYTFESHPAAEIFLVPGGLGTRCEMHNPMMLNWVKKQAENAELILSVCTGSLVLAAAGLLPERQATTHHLRFELLRQTEPRCIVLENKRVVVDGKIITSGGIAAGIDMSFVVVEQLLGTEVAEETARYMEFPYQPSSHGK